MPYVQCGSCGGSGTKQVARRDEKGKTVYVTEDCKNCRGSGVIPK